MQINQLPIGLLLQPSLRSIAYLSVMKELGVAPQEVVLMDVPISKLDAVRVESRNFNYKEDFFDVDLDIRQILENWGCVTHVVSTGSANDPQVHAAIDQCESAQIIFTGGGILSKKTLSRGKSFIHAHPGYLPEFRGSTCFYYSLLTDLSLAATVFFMEEKIDTGQIIARQRFRMNYQVEKSQPLFVDYILDPYIRAETLKKALVQYIKKGLFEQKPQPLAARPAYYVMHPLLRHLAINRVNQHYNQDAPMGVFLDED